MHSWVITGGAGFIGSSLCQRILEQNSESRVLVVDSFDPFYDPNWKRRWVRDLQAIGGTRFGLVEADLAEGPAALHAQIPAGFLETRPAFVHLAAKAGVRPSVVDPVSFARANCMGTFSALELARRLEAPVFVQASSSSVYGRTSSVPFRENQPANHPQSPYAATKIAAEVFCENAAILHSMACVSLRLFTVYGPKQRPDLAIHKFTRLISEEKPIPVFGDGSSSRDYTFIGDILDGILGAVDYALKRQMLSSSGFHEIFNLGSSHPISLSSLIEQLGALVGKTPRIERQPFPGEDLLITFADVSKAEAAFDYRPQTSLVEGLGHFYRWYQAWQTSN